jgi:hypothetical protein
MKIILVFLTILILAGSVQAGPPLIWCDSVRYADSATYTDSAGVVSTDVMQHTLDSAEIMAIVDDSIATLALDSGNFAANTVASSDINWPQEWISMTTVHGLGHEPEEPLVLSLPAHIKDDYAASEGDSNMIYLFQDSCAVDTAITDSIWDTIFVSVTIPYDFTIDTVTYSYRSYAGETATDSAVIEAIALKAANDSGWCSDTDIGGAVADVEHKNIRWTTYYLATGGDAVSRGDELGLEFIVAHEGPGTKMQVSRVGLIGHR